MKKTTLLAAIGLSLTMTGCAMSTTTSPDRRGVSATEKSNQRESLDAGATAALSNLYAQVPEAKNMVQRARAVLVFPQVVNAGLVVGGSYGKGVLRVNGRTDGYYSTTAASAGLIAGADSKAVYILFMTDEALQRFKNSKGWTIGADASVSVLNAGASTQIDSQTARSEVLGYVLTNAGLMANLSVDGTKISRIDL